MVDRNDPVGSLGYSVAYADIGNGAYAPRHAAVGDAAVVNASKIRPNDTAAYTAGDLFGSTTANSGDNIFELAVARANDRPALISRFRAKINDSGWSGKRVRLHFHKALPTITTIGDNGAFANGSTATESNKIGMVDITFGAVASSDGIVKGFAAPPDASYWLVEPADGTNKIYVIVEVLDAVTPAASKTLSIGVEVVAQN